MQPCIKMENSQKQLKEKKWRRGSRKQFSFVLPKGKYNIILTETICRIQYKASKLNGFMMFALMLGKWNQQNYCTSGPSSRD